MMSPGSAFVCEVGYGDEPDTYELSALKDHGDVVIDSGEIRPEDVPVGDSTEDRRRQGLVC